MERVVDSFNKLFIFLVENFEPFLLILFFTFLEFIAYFMDMNCGFQRKYVLKKKKKKKKNSVAYHAVLKKLLN